MTLKSIDRARLWHPYTSVKHPCPVNCAASSGGTAIVLDDGRELIDGISSWWCAAHGHRPEKVVEAIREQARKMPHVMFAGFTHGPAAVLAEKLTGVLPAGLDRFFYADSGSVAVECAIKMAIQYQAACGRPRRQRMAALRGGYHGDTLGAMSVSDPGGMHRIFRGMLPEQFFADRPGSPFGGRWDEGDLSSMTEIVETHADEIAGVIVEPIFQGANAMWFYHPEYLRKLRALCDRHDIVLIFDEIASGFGRTGKLFASAYAGTAPDIMCIGKALTAGTVTLACAAAADRIAGPIEVFLHGPTFMANPLACAAAAAAIDLLSEYDWAGNVRRIEKTLRAALEPYRGKENVRDVRVLGAVGVLEVDRIPSAETVEEIVLKTGVWLRPFGNFIYTMPPFVTGDDELARIAETMGMMADAGK